jgi:hypothetical protein
MEPAQTLKQRTDRMNHLKIVIALGGLALVFIGGPSLQAVDLAKLQTSYEQAIKAYEEKNYPLYLDHIGESLQNFPNHPLLLYRLAAAYALNGMPLKAMPPLRQTAAMGLVFDIWKNSDFRSLQRRPEFKKIMDLYAKNASPLKGSRRAWAIPGKGLLVEGLAYDPQEKKFLAGSVRRRTILSLDRAGRSEVLSKPEDGLWAVMGLRVDPPRRKLWASLSALPQMEGFKPEDEGRAGLACYDLKTGRLQKKYLLPGKPERHLLGDLAVDAKGTVVATDSQSPVLYTPSPSGDGLEIFLKFDSFQSLQGIDFSPDGRVLFVADYSVGVYVIDRQTKNVRLLEPPRNAALIGIDGLYYYRGSLLAVQNGLRPNRILRIFLNKNFDRIERLTVLEANEPSMSEPTLGVVVDDVFYFNANSQWGLVDDKGQAAPDNKWADPVVLQINLAEPQPKK